MSRLSGFQRAVLALLLLLTAAALLPWHPAGPFDARDYLPAKGMHLDYPALAGLYEPLVAPGQALMGAPDFRLAFGATAIWLAVAALAWSLWRRGAWWWRPLRGLALGLGAAWSLAAYLLFVSHIHFAGWRLSVDDPDAIIADLQSHTLGSHDGLVRAPFNLRWHLARGYNVAAITEHDDPRGSFYAHRIAAQQFPQLGVIPGTEVGSEYGGFLLGLGLKEGEPIPNFWEDRTDYSRRFIDTVHNRHGGAVVSMAWRLDAEQVRKLAASGVDGFEIANNGHPDIPQDVRDTMLELGRAGKTVLVADTDWHGWGGFNRTWNVFHVPGAAQMSAQQRADAVVNILRARNGAVVTPVVAGYLGPPSTARLLFTPLTELVRYGAELSLPRLAGWWLWGGLLIAVAPWLVRRGVRPGRLLLIGWLTTVGAGLLWRGIQIYFTTPQGDVVLSDVTHELGWMGIYVALPLLVAAAVLGVLERRRSVRRVL